MTTSRKNTIFFEEEHHIFNTHYGVIEKFFTQEKINFKNILKIKKPTL